MRYTLILFATLLFGAASAALAVEKEIQFPVVQLDNCANETACFAYCEEPAHFDACMQFAQTSGLASEEEVQKYEKAKVVVERGGPGGCDSPKSCDAYCSDINHLNECLAFAEQEGMMQPEELAEAKKVQTALDAGAKLPGGCTNKQSCGIYCEDSAHIEECFAFAEAAGFIDEQEREHTKKAIELMKSGETPGGCTSRDTCEKYCMEDGHFEECMEFGVKSGFMGEEEAQRMRDMGSFGPPEDMPENMPEGPGGCRGEECFDYCMDEANLEECVKFGEQMMGEDRRETGQMMQEQMEERGEMERDERQVWEHESDVDEASRRQYEILDVSPQQLEFYTGTDDELFSPRETSGDDWSEYDANWQSNQWQAPQDFIDPYSDELPDSFFNGEESFKYIDPSFGDVDSQENQERQPSDDLQFENKEEYPPDFSGDYQPEIKPQSHIRAYLGDVLKGLLSI